MMVKKIAALLLTVLTCISTMAVCVANAADDKPEVTSFVNELNKFGCTVYAADDSAKFDMNSDEVIDVFDLICMKKRLIEGEEEIKVADVVKLTCYLQGVIKDLDIHYEVKSEFSPNNVNEYTKALIGNEMSHDFYFRRAHVCHDENWQDVIMLDFIDSSVLSYQESCTFYDWVASPEELEEIIANRDGGGFCIGIRDGHYAIALND